MNTIKEVYEECLENGWLGTERAKVLYCRKEYYVVGRAVHGSIFLATTDDHGETRDASSFVNTTEVEWIGNKQKTKKIYKAILWATPAKDEALERWILKNSPKVDLVLKWLPEDKYPPIEVEVGE